ncbi:glycosyl transferase family 2 [Sediminihabitans luteus]|uniref:Glycosyl transferase family 2 n=1 Tax=Sediminihabitans luteus TaxID=1138585 RepID=A0A2M9CDA4_9CELL|nr:glycosyltransferase family 2 protein [Sediminihabitans luteus]PJJ69869.1 glycosyl transferase family 2 [Sediminihabitans luteus]GII99188.1 hypothetical protein Slu03_15660 [Sediminihabitans luteus]
MTPRSLAERHVVVGIPTFRRPDRLARLLAALGPRLAEIPASYRPAVIVVDNDPNGSALATVDAATVPSLRYVREPVPGIAAARNRLLDEAGDGALVAFIDDDELPREGWLTTLLGVWEESRPAAVMGRVISVFDEDVDPWVLATGAFTRRPRTTGLEIPVAAAGNLLVDTVQTADLDVRFDAGLGLAGGEDTLFSRTLVSRGGRIVWCNESETEDFVPAERTTRTWTMRRAFNGGNSAVRVELALSTSRTARAQIRVTGVLGGAARVVAGVGRHVYGRLRNDLTSDARGLRTVHRGFGMMSASFGHVHAEYARS